MTARAALRRASATIKTELSAASLSQSRPVVAMYTSSWILRDLEVFRHGMSILTPHRIAFTTYAQRLRSAVFEH
ncbi:MAG TPA: hypothetical protein VER03_16285 [Bryobacteraceae bacterium]|nr:hypothetical protein [Bryobacteraceae bacterium]